MNSVPVIVNQLTKSYGKTMAADKLTFSADRGELYGFIGPDGAGKTTLFRMLSTLLLPDSGKALVEGLDVHNEYRKVRKIIGYMPGRFSLYQDLSVEENLRFFATIFGTTIQENYHLIRDIYTQIEPFRSRRAGALSGGMKQKLALCCALIHKPSVLILDEPATGVDAVSRKEFWEMLRKLKSEGICILVSTPYMDDAGQCDRISLMQGGTLLDSDTPAAIIRKFPHPLFSIKTHVLLPVLKSLDHNSLVRTAYPFGQEVHVTLKKGADPVIFSRMIADEGHEGVECSRIDASIEDYFMEITGGHHD